MRRGGRSGAVLPVAVGEAALMSSAQERGISQRVAGMEHILAAQRMHVHDLEARGFDISGSLALLEVMESIADKFRTAWKLLQVQRPRSSQTPAGVPLAPYRLPTGKGVPSAALPRSETTTFACAHCGLALGVRNGDDALVYDVGQWARQCKHQTLQTPALCQLLPVAAAGMH